MKPINASELKQAILALEIKRRMQEKELASHAHDFLESIKPVNLLKSTLDGMASSPELPGKLLNAVIGVGAGMLLKKIVVGKSGNIFKRITGTALEYIIANTVAKNAGGIKKGFMFLRNIFPSHKRPLLKEK